MHIPLLAKSMGFEMFRQTSHDLKSKSVQIWTHNLIQEVLTCADVCLPESQLQPITKQL